MKLVDAAQSRFLAEDNKRHTHTLSSSSAGQSCGIRRRCCVAAAGRLLAPAARGEKAAEGGACPGFNASTPRAKTPGTLSLLLYCSKTKYCVLRKVSKSFPKGEETPFFASMYRDALTSSRFGRCMLNRSLQTGAIGRLFSYTRCASSLGL